MNSFDTFCRRLPGLLLPVRARLDQRREVGREPAALLPRHVHLADGRPTQDQDEGEVWDQGETRRVEIMF